MHGIVRLRHDACTRGRAADAVPYARSAVAAAHDVRCAVRLPQYPV